MWGGRGIGQRLRGVVEIKIEDLFERGGQRSLDGGLCQMLLVRVVLQVRSGLAAVGVILWQCPHAKGHQKSGHAQKDSHVYAHGDVIQRGLDRVNKRAAR